MKSTKMKFIPMLKECEKSLKCNFIDILGVNIMLLILLLGFGARLLGKTETAQKE